MPRKKQEETNAEVTPEVTETSEETSTEVKTADSAETTEDKPKRTRKAKAGNAAEEQEQQIFTEPVRMKAKADNAAEEPSFVESVIDTVSSAVGIVAETVGSVATTITDAVGITGGDETVKVSGGNRAQRIGVVTSDKMTKTVVVRVDRLIKHPKYRRYVRRKKQFMAHDELGASMGDKVRIVETRPLSARKRWRVIEIVQKAAK